MTTKSHECSACGGTGLRNEGWPVVDRAWQGYQKGCPHYLAGETIRRPVNGYNIEVGTPMDRCAIQPPEDWPWPPSRTASTNEMAHRWLASGGSGFVFGHCCLGGCPLQPRFCAACGHREDAGHALGVCRTLSGGPGGSWPCGCDAFMPLTCPVCLGSGRISDVRTARDAMTDAVTLNLSVGLGSPLRAVLDEAIISDEIENDIYNASVYDPDQEHTETAEFYAVRGARLAARAAFRAVPALREE